MGLTAELVVIDYETFSKIHDCHFRRGLSIAQIARTLGLHPKTVATWLARSRFEPRRTRQRGSALDSFKPRITQLLNNYPYSTQQVFHRLRQSGYSGGLTILRDYLRRIRPTKRPVYLNPRRRNGYWTLERVKEIANSCSTLSEFRKLHATAHNIALKRGWMAEVCPHLPFSGQPSSTYTLRIEHASGPKLDINFSNGAERSSFLVVGTYSIADKDVQPNWSRDFLVSGKYTLEQLNEMILRLLGWNQDHLYEFRIADRVYANLIFLEEDDVFVESDKCVSCDIPLQRVGLSVGDTFAYIFDFANNHVFRLTVLSIRPASAGKVTPKLIAYIGKNILQYPGALSKAEARAFGARTPEVVAPAPKRDRFRIRFVRDSDASVLREWRTSNDKRKWQKAVTILESRNQSIEDLAAKIERSECHVRRWIQAFNRFGLEGLQKPDGRRGPIKSHHMRAVARDQKARRILEIVHAKPNAYGINRSNWNRPSIKRAYEQQHKETISVSTVGALLRRSGHTVRKARKVLSSPDPHYREKVELLLSTLHNLKPSEFLFFVDELGPLRVKKYGGRALVRKNEALTYQQRQKHRGVIMMSGALSATTNQVTWIYGPAKNSRAMIDLMELLYNQYFSARKLYVTWDSASWHKSAMLVGWLDAFNSTTKKTDDGPLIELIPLPTSSQFLDVIEAVFSGMKRAVVHHSDYRDVTEMKRAISLHFTERNAYFRENPRRVGKEIWKLDFFDDNDNIRSGNYRDW